MGQVRLILGGIDERVLVVVEQAEEPIKANVDTRRLHHVEVEGFQSNAAGGEFSSNVTVGEQHGPTLAMML